MKSETKELIEWIKNLLWKNKNRCKGNKFDFELFDKAVSFLNSLPEIESHLTRGGYIQDKNGTPCCEGDLIKVTVSDGSYEVQGVLTWENYCFCLYDKKGCCNHILCPTYIYEKVEK